MTSAGTADLRVCSVECTNPPANPGTFRHVGLGVSRFLQVGRRRPATYGWVSHCGHGRGCRSRGRGTRRVPAGAVGVLRSASRDRVSPATRNEDVGARLRR